MLKQNFSNRRTFHQERAQAIVEFAIALPVLLMMLIGIFEVGRMVFIYAAVNNASREAARYASAVGLNDSGKHKYNHCWAIRDIAKRSAFFARITNANIGIYYDHGPTDAIYTDGHGPDNQTERDLLLECDHLLQTEEDPDVTTATVTSGDRVIVTITAAYSPIVRLIPISSRTFESTSARTILGIFELDN
jgi:Flp pilus assembly protein TadG